MLLTDVSNMGLKSVVLYRYIVVKSLAKGQSTDVRQLVFRH